MSAAIVGACCLLVGIIIGVVAGFAACIWLGDVFERRLKEWKGEP